VIDEVDYEFIPLMLKPIASKYSFELMKNNTGSRQPPISIINRGNCY